MKWAIPSTPHSDTCFTGYKNSDLIQHSFISYKDERLRYMMVGFQMIIIIFIFLHHLASAQITESIRSVFFMNAKCFEKWFLCKSLTNRNIKLHRSLCVLLIINIFNITCSISVDKTTNYAKIIFSRNT